MATGPLTVLSGHGLQHDQFRKEPIALGTLAATSVWPPHRISKYIIPAGTIVGLNSNTGQYLPVRGTQLDTSETHTETVLGVERTDCFEVGDNIKIMLASDWVTYGTDTGHSENLGAITAIVDGVSIAITTHVEGSYTAGDYVYVAAATDYAADVAVGILMTDVDLRNELTGVAAATGPVSILTGFGGDQRWERYDRTKYETILNLYDRAELDLEAAFGVPIFC